MKIEQILATNAFFLKYLPGVDRICKNCYKLSLPRSGPDVRWYAAENSHCEVRLSDPKKFGYPAQQRLYLTHNYRKQMTLHVRCNGIMTCSPSFYDKVTQPDTHIAWEVNEFENIVNRTPAQNTQNFQVCQCKKVL